MVKKVILIIIFISLIILVGTWPISILSKVFYWISVALNWLAKTLNFFNWNGLI